MIGQLVEWIRRRPYRQPTDKTTAAAAMPGSLAAAHDLVRAMAAGDLEAFNEALPKTSAMHVAVVAVVLGSAPAVHDLQDHLRALAVLAELGEITDHTDQ